MEVAFRQETQILYTSWTMFMVSPDTFWLLYLSVCFMIIVYSINKHKLPEKTNKVNESYLKELIILLVLKLYIRQLWKLH